MPKITELAQNRAGSTSGLSELSSTVFREQRQEEVGCSKGS